MTDYFKTHEDVMNGTQAPRTVVGGLNFYDDDFNIVNERHCDEWSVQQHFQTYEYMTGQQTREEEVEVVGWFRHYENDCKHCCVDGCDGSGCVSLS